MSRIEINKIVGAILSAGVVAMVIGIIGDALVRPDQRMAPSLETSAGKTPAAAPVAEKILPPVGPMMAEADAAAGKMQANKCKACHDMTKTKKKKLGPPLWDIVGSGMGGNKGYAYSKAMAGMGGTWSYEELNAFLAAPKGYVKGTKMTFAGVKKAKDRANLIAFLRSLSDAPKPLP